MIEMQGIQRQVGQRVRELREKKGLSQEALAAVCNLHRTYVGLIERGERNLSLTTVEDLARGLEVPVAELFQSASEAGAPEPALKKNTKPSRKPTASAPATATELAAHLATIRQILIAAKLTDPKRYRVLYISNLGSGGGSAEK